MTDATRKFLSLYRELLDVYGRQGWWPGEGRFEIMVGALLTQNTNWRNAARAIENLRGASMLEPETILGADIRALERCLKPSGYYRIKAKRLRNLCRWLVEAGGVDALAKRETGCLRRALLTVSGVGPETADAILLYAFARPVFVVDAYAYRVFTRLGLILDGDRRPGYEELRRMVEREMKEDERALNEFHALIVRHGKHPCRPTPRCEECHLVRQCPHGRASGKNLCQTAVSPKKTPV